MFSYRQKKNLYDPYKFSRVVSYTINKGNSEYLFLLECGHKISKYCNPGRFPERMICPECYKETHDKYGNEL